MTLNKQTGNMYPWISHTWNPIRGKCPHGCSYCYMKRFPLGPLRLDEKALQDNLGEGDTIFVGSSTDMWADEVKSLWIYKVLKVCHQYPGNTYFFQTKNPISFNGWVFPENTLLGITIETDREEFKYSKAPPTYDRFYEFLHLPEPRKMVSIEPIMDFDLDVMRSWVKLIKPEFVSIGADSKGHHLPEPPPEKVKELIQELEKFTTVKVKPNLKRLM